jgi:hypothetical protein
MERLSFKKYLLMGVLNVKLKLIKLLLTSLNLNNKNFQISL